jgi:hypothetical protein
MNSELLVLVGVIFLLSLVGALVLFKVLQSTAIIQRKGYQAGGALAGFLLIFAALYGAYHQLNAQQQSANEVWTVVGEVNLENDDQNSQEVEVSLMPPPPTTLSENGGDFRFDRIPISVNGPLELKFQIDGYLTESLLVDENLAFYDSDNRRITLKEPVTLVPSSRTGAAGRTTGVDPSVSVTDSTDLPDTATRSLPDNATMSGLVLKYYRSRSPLDNAVVELRNASNGSLTARAYTGKDGQYVLRDLPAGDYDLMIRLGEQELEIMAPSERRIDIEGGEQKRLNITVRQDAAVPAQR